MMSTSSDPFLLSREEWLSVQVYVAEALALPVTGQQLEGALGIAGDPSIAGATDFSDLVGGYQTLNGHCAFWRDHAFPETVSLADDIVHYGTKVRVYYKPLLDISDLWQDGNDPLPTDVMKFSAILLALSKQADTFATNANQAAADVAQFAKSSTDDQAALAKLKAIYENKFGADSDYVKTVQNELDQQQQAIADATAEYNHDVVVASTTPTYAWFPPPPLLPFGLVAAAIVAGVYGDRAVKAQQRIAAAQAQVETLDQQLKKATKVLNSVYYAQKGLADILDKLNSALVVIQQIEGIWSAISSDLKNLRAILNEDIDQALPILKSLGIAEAIEQWTKLTDEADKYRANAFIQIPAAQAA